MNPAARCGTLPRNQRGAARDEPTVSGRSGTLLRSLGLGGRAEDAQFPRHGLAVVARGEPRRHRRGPAPRPSRLCFPSRSLWQTKITDYTLHQGYGSSPAIYKSLAIVAADNKGTGVIAG